MRLPLDISRHCVETAAKKAHDARVREYFKASAEQQAALEAEMELLLEFLRTVDFGLLRSRHPELSGGLPVKLALERGANGRFFAVWGGTRAECPLLGE
jgi:hypothetical protein